MALLREVLQFLVFLVLLAFSSSLLTNLRTADKEYLYADSAINSSDLQSAGKPEFSKELFAGIHSLITFQTGKTEAGEDVSAHIWKRLIPTLQLSVFAILFGGVLGVYSGLIAVYDRSGICKKIFSFLSVFILSTPIFVAAVLLFLVFFLYLDILPPGGYEAGNITYLILPGIALGSRVFARIFYYSLSESEKELDSGYIFFLRTRGFKENRIIFHFILRKVLPLLLVLLLLDFSSLLSGSIIVEEFFFYPGIGKSMYGGIKNMDGNLLRALLFYSGIVFYILNRIAKTIQMNLTMDKGEKEFV